MLVAVDGSAVSDGVGHGGRELFVLKGSPSSALGMILEYLNIRDRKVDAAL